MKKQILNLGNALTRVEQKQIKGGIDCSPTGTGIVFNQECRDAGLGEFMSGGCPQNNMCFGNGPGGCIDYCLQDHVAAGR